VEHVTGNKRKKGEGSKEEKKKTVPVSCSEIL
jgi:hypothetical protein